MKKTSPAGAGVSLSSDLPLLPVTNDVLPVASIESEITKNITRSALHSSTPSNRILAALPEAEYERLLPHLQPVRLHTGQELYSVNTPSHGLLFLNEGVVTTELASADGSEVEIVPIGYEGVVGRAGCVLGDTPTFRHAVVNVAGQGLWLPLEALQAEFRRGSTLSRLLVDYLHVLLVEAGRIALCKRRHELTARLSQWLLLLRERAQSNEIAFTQECIADLLGARPSEVTVASGLLWKSGLIRFNNNRVAILDPQRLQQNACECSAIIHQEHEHLFCHD
jgi:CRP-like cAMP-binding protein